MSEQGSLKLYPQANIISTLEDRQGERRTKEDLESFCSSFPKRLPIGVQHDMGRVTQGYLDNFAVIPFDSQPGEWKLVGDLYLDESFQCDEALRGLSLSFSKMTQANTDDPAGCVYLPFPHYRNEVLNRLLLSTQSPLAIGRWHRKGMGGEAVGIIVGFVTFLISPLWNKLYDAKIHPFLLDVLGSLSGPEFKEIAFDYCQTINLDGHDVRLIFVSDHANWLKSLQPNHIRQGMEEAIRFLTNSDVAAVKVVMELRLKYDVSTSLYHPSLVQYSDGEHITMR
jgi:hypothetical protein